MFERNMLRNMHILKETFKCDNKTKITLPTAKAECFKVNYIRQDKTSENSVLPVYEGCVTLQQPFSASETHEAAVVDARTFCLAKEGFKAVYELTFDIKESTISNNFEPGDTIAILPENDRNDVDFVLERLGLSDEADTVYVIENIDTKGKSQIPKHVPVRCTLMYTLKHCLDLQSVVKKLFIRALSSYCSLEEDRKNLEYMCSKEGSELYSKYVLNRRTSLLDILHAFPSCKPSIVCILTHLPRLLPRPYSIVNSRTSNGNIIKICFSVQHLENGRKGLTTERLERLATNKTNKHKKTNGDLVTKLENLELDNETVQIYLRKNLGFRFPNEEANVLMIGPGTGVAPFIGLLEKRRKTLQECPLLKPGDLWLFYGCRDGNVDFIYKEDLNGFIEERVLTRFNVAYSRMEHSEIKYVQDALKSKAKQVGEFLTDGAYVLVCGDVSNMAKQVEAILTECIECTGRTHEESIQFVKSMHVNKKYLVDIWS